MLSTSSALQTTAAYCNTLHHITTHCIALQHTIEGEAHRILCAETHSNTQQHTATPATHSNTLQRTATCNRGRSFLILSAETHCSALQCTATHNQGQRCPHPHRCNTLQHTAAHCNTLQHTIEGDAICIFSADTHCSTLQHTATRCNTL